MQPSWWSDDEALYRYLTDLIAAELTRLRPGISSPARPWPAGLPIGPGGLEIDSLELMSLATAVGQALHIHRSGMEDYLLARRTIGDWMAIARDSLALFSDDITFLTSGSTGAPKACTHALARLEREVDCLLQIVGPSHRLVSAVPSHHIYGFIFTVLLPNRLGVPVVDGLARSATGLKSQLRAGDVVVGHPEFWRMLGRSPLPFPPGVLGITSSAPCPAEVATSVIEGGLSRLIEIYGSSETAGVGWRDSPSADYRLFDYWKVGETGTTLVFSPSGQVAEVVALQDILVWQDERHFRPTGRQDGAVQVGGVNVFPARVASMLTSHPDVAAGMVRLMRPDEGNRLKAFIVPRDPAADLAKLEERLLEWSRQHLSVAEQPKAISFGAAVPVGPLGKPIDWNVGRSAQRAPVDAT